MMFLYDHTAIIMCLSLTQWSWYGVSLDNILNHFKSDTTRVHLFDININLLYLRLVIYANCEHMVIVFEGNVAITIFVNVVV